MGSSFGRWPRTVVIVQISVSVQIVIRSISFTSHRRPRFGDQSRVWAAIVTIPRVPGDLELTPCTFNAQDDRLHHDASFGLLSRLSHLGLFGLDKLRNVDQTVAHLKEALNQIV